MLRLLDIEFHKLKYSKSTKVLVITYFVVLTFIALIATIEFDLGQLHIRVAEQGIFNFPYIWHFNSYVAALLKFFLGIVIVSMVSNEYSNRTLKQNLIDGMSKKEFILSKFLTVILFSAVSTVFVFVLSLVLGLIFSDFTEASIIFSEMEYLFAYFIKLVGFFSFCLFLGMLIKRSAFALGFLFLWWIIEGLIYLVVKVFNRGTDVAENVMQFLPLGSMSNLVKEPASRLNVVKSAANTLGSEFEKDYGIHWYQILIVLAWTAIFIFLSYGLLKKRDL